MRASSLLASLVRETSLFLRSNMLHPINPDRSFILSFSLTFFLLFLSSSSRSSVIVISIIYTVFFLLALPLPLPLFLFSSLLFTYSSFSSSFSVHTYIPFIDPSSVAARMSHAYAYAYHNPRT
ncbi:hypothetical protein SCHPADRAFT_688432 [Schizopora paradoxa]|uniref:Uncharacterized protein n=1 Tax=Schizopora paradoxa TaxID=27342 RepID=A0A0H2R584_9AGAM|nr:hypothetical protein SCHPADRAFT_688432 [Schizopora paradoxa]